METTELIEMWNAAAGKVQADLPENGMAQIQNIAEYGGPRPSCADIVAIHDALKAAGAKPHVTELSDGICVGWKHGRIDITIYSANIQRVDNDLLAKYREAVPSVYSEELSGRKSMDAQDMLSMTAQATKQ